jgi:hypothetical protein
MESEVKADMSLNVAAVYGCRTEFWRKHAREVETIADFEKKSGMLF